MKKRVEVVKVIKKTTSVSMAAITAVGAIGTLPQAVSKAEDISKYRIENNEYLSRLKHVYGKGARFDLAFKERDNSTDEVLFTHEMGEKLLKEGKIQINAGNVWDMKDVGFRFANYGRGDSNSCFETENPEFIKEFYNSDKIKIKITTPEGDVIESEVQNKMDSSERSEFEKKINSKNESEVIDKKDNSKENDFLDANKEKTESKEDADKDREKEIVKNSNYEIKKNAYMTRLRWNLLDKPEFNLAFRESDSEGNVIFTHEMGEKLLKEGKIQINDGKMWDMKDTGFKFANHGNGDSNSCFVTENPEFIKEFYKSDIIKIKITTPEGNTIESEAPNQMSSSQKENFEKQIKDKEGGSSEKVDTEKVSQNNFYSASVKMMHSSNGDKNYVYKDESMASPVLSQKAEIVETNSGKKLIMHFEVKKIMGATAYATDFKLTNESFAKLEKNDEGNIKTEFILLGDNSGICIVDLPKIEDKVYEGHIYSNIMDNYVALKIYDIKKTGNVKNGLSELIKNAEKNIEGKTFYSAGKDKFDKALSEAKKNQNSGENYINLIKSMAGLREKLENPFSGDELFFIPVEATSAFANPPGRAESILKPWAKVRKVDGKTIIELNYTTYLDYSGKQYVTDVKIFDKDGKKELPLNLQKNEDGTAKLTFEMPFYPDGGVFKTILKSPEGRVYDSDLILDYSRIQKGIFPGLLEEAIHEIDEYQKGWTGPYDGKISVDEKDMYTESSFSKYLKVLNKCKEDLKPEFRATLTQEMIDHDIEMLKEAKKSLIYKAMAGNGKNANLGTKGISNPGNVYSDSQPHVLDAPWAGSKIKFAGNIYKVLDSGIKLDKSTNKKTDTGNLLIMADNYSVNRAWSSKEPKDRKTENVIRWDKSDLREYLNGEFYNTFANLEKSAIKNTKIKTEDGSVSGGISAVSIETDDNIFILDSKEMSSHEYGLINPGSRINGNFYFVRNLFKHVYEDKYSLAGVKPKGNIETLNQNFNRKTESYPVMNLDKSKIMMTIQSKAGIPNGIKPVKETEDNIWDIVLKDDSSKLDITESSANGRKISLNYKTVNADGKTLVAAIVKDGDIKNGKLKSIGKVSKILKSGKVEFNIPEFDKSTDRLYVMAMNLEANTVSSSNAVEVDMSAMEVNKDDQKQKAKISYEAPVEMLKHKMDELSMSNNAVEHTVKVVEQDGNTTITMTFKPMKIQNLEGHLIKMSVDGKPVEVLEKDENGNLKTISFTVKGNPKKITGVVEVDMMNALNGGKSAPQNVDIAVNWDSKTNVVSETTESEKKPESKDGKIENAKADKDEIRFAINALNVDKIKVIVPKKGLKAPIRRARSLSSFMNLMTVNKSSDENRIEVTIEKKDGKWVLSENDKNKVKNFHVEEKSDGKLNIKMALSDTIKSVADLSEGHNIKVIAINEKNEVLKESYIKIEKEESNPKTTDNSLAENTSTGNTSTGNASTGNTSTGNTSTGNTSTTSGKFKTYDIQIHMKKNGSNEDSMSSKSVDNIVKIIDKGDTSEVIMTFKPMKFMGLEGHLLKMSVEGKPVKILASDDKGRPTKVSFEVKGHPQRITAVVEVDAMNEINGGKSAPQKVDIVFDWNNKSNIKEVEGIKNPENKEVSDITTASKERISGKDRYSTSVAISRKYFKSSENIVLVSGINYADALVSASYAKAKNAPTLLSGKNDVSDDVMNEIKRLGAKNITVIGGVNSVSETVIDKLKSSGLNIERISGKDRYETSEKLAENLLKNYSSKKIAVVNGTKNADALSVSSLSTKDNIPVVMIKNDRNNHTISNIVKSWDIKEVLAIGGKDSISESTLSSIDADKKLRISGSDRYETALMIAKKSYPQAKTVFIANGESMIDALSTGSVTYKAEAPIVLSKKNSMKENVKLFVSSIKNIITVGGENTINIK